MNEIMYDICICIFGCVTIEKYRKQIDLVNHTWGKWCMKNNNVKILYFLGEEKIIGGKNFHLTSETTLSKTFLFVNNRSLRILLFI